MSTLSPIPELEHGDRLTRAEFERRYEAMPRLKKAELIEGRVYVGSPVRADGHGAETSMLITWLGNYLLDTPGVQACDNTTVRLDEDNEPQPDAFLRILPERGGRTSNDGPYVSGGPELVCEVAASSVSYDLHDKLHAYRRNGVQEYLGWRTQDRALDWFALREGRYEPLAPDAAGLLRSEVFPGLWLDRASLLEGELQLVRAGLERGLASPQHAEFVARLAT